MECLPCSGLGPHPEHDPLAEKRDGTYAVNNGLGERGSPWGSATLVCLLLLPSFVSILPAPGPPAVSLPPHPAPRGFAPAVTSALKAFLLLSPVEIQATLSVPLFSALAHLPGKFAWLFLHFPSLPLLAQPELHHCTHLHLIEGPSPTRSSRRLGSTYLCVQGAPTSVCQHFECQGRKSFPSAALHGLSASAGDLGLIPGSRRSLGEGNGNPLQYACLKNPMNRGTWWAIVDGVTKSHTWLSTRE